jgi:HK97 gp10 family phage protein
MAGYRYVDASEVRHLAIDLREAPARTTIKVSRAIAKTAHDIEADAKAIVPVDTGNLKNSISTDLDRAELSAEIGPTADYGRYVEEGTSEMAPHAYLGPAYDRHAHELVSAIEQIIGDFL